MTFNSIPYAFFLPTVVALYWAVPRRSRNLVLLGASYLFYAAWDWRFLSLLIVSTGVDFALGKALHRTPDEHRRRRKALLLTSVAVNLGILGFFKYFDFFVDSAADLLGATGLVPNRAFLEIVLPVGISFYTFQTISYTFDVFRRRIGPTDDLLVFAVYVAFFPQLVAGPIERARHLLPQLEADRPPPNSDRLASGVGLILLGLFRKVVLADTMAPLVEDTFTDPGDAGTAAVTVAVVAFAIQIYGDFSGYTDMARGSARLLSVELMHNFRQPYLSRNITEFWRRWHISLSNWLRDYLYIPLGGNRGSELRTYRNLMIVMLLGGLWHGAGWNFVVWGGLHGLFLGLHRWLRPQPDLDEPLRAAPGQLARIVSTFGAVCLAWVFFRAESVQQAFEVLRAWFRPEVGVPLADVVLVAWAATVMVAVDVAQRFVRFDVGAVTRRRPATAGAAVGMTLVAVVLFSGSTPVPFIYFQF